MWPNPDPCSRVVCCHHYDQADYPTLWHLQRTLAEARRQGQCSDQLILAEHTPVYTIGRSGHASDILIPPSIPVVYSDRGGRITYHGPGQLMVYLVWDMSGHSRQVRQLVQQLEQVVQQSLAYFGITAHSNERRPGLWVGADKIAAIGLRIRQGVAYHGMAINRDPDLTAFDAIVPCGIRDAGVTSMTKLGFMTTREELEQQILHAFRAIFDVTLITTCKPSSM
ncbi:MAG: lipoyl(octanoyl) transferase LipB [Magnetococcales bacterium]|nr:lipoyl(octanoyl) transferase LipB [Magnetococcales bacterium]